MTEFFTGLLLGIILGTVAVLLLSTYRSSGRSTKEPQQEAQDFVRHTLMLDQETSTLLSRDLQRVSSLLERLLQEAGSILQEVRQRPPSGSSQPPTQTARSIPGDQASWMEQGRTGGERMYDRDTVQHPYVPTVSGREVPALGDAPYAAPTTTEQRATPPFDAVKVEAKEDVIVVSSRQPPEAWLERVHPGEAKVLLNRGAQLTDHALQRWSTFFQWENRAPGRAYIVTEPAVISWDDSHRVGRLLRQGRARPA